MGRIRNIKPEFFLHERLYQLGESSGHGIYLSRLYEGLWTQADCQGLFEWRPLRIKLAVFPWYAVDVEPMLDALEREHMIVRYEVDGKPYGWIPTFSTHQKIHPMEMRRGPKCPEPEIEGYVAWEAPPPKSSGRKPLEKPPRGKSRVTSHVTSLRSSPVTSRVTSQGISHVTSHVTSQERQEVREVREITEGGTGACARAIPPSTEHAPASHLTATQGAESSPPANETSNSPEETAAHASECHDAVPSTPDAETVLGEWSDAALEATGEPFVSADRIGDKRRAQAIAEALPEGEHRRASMRAAWRDPKFRARPRLTFFATDIDQWQRAGAKAIAVAQTRPPPAAQPLPEEPEVPLTDEKRAETQRKLDALVGRRDEARTSGAKAPSADAQIAALQGGST